MQKRRSPPIDIQWIAWQRALDGQGNAVRDVRREIRYACVTCREVVAGIYNDERLTENALIDDATVPSRSASPTSCQKANTSNRRCITARWVRALEPITSELSTTRARTDCAIGTPRSGGGGGGLSARKPRSLMQTLAISMRGDWQIHSTDTSTRPAPSDSK